MKMINIRRCSPASDFDKMAEMMERIWSSPAPQPANILPVDVVERDGALHIKALAPGVHPQDISVSFENGSLTIKASHQKEEESGEGKIYRREIVTGEWTRSIRLPETALGDQIEASLEKGILTVRIPLQQPEPPRAIQVEVRATEPGA